MVQGGVIEHPHDGADGAGLGLGGAEDEPTDAGMDQRAGAHQARFDRHVERGAGQPVVADGARGVAQGDDLGVGRGVAGEYGLVAAPPDDGTVEHDDGAHRHLAPPARKPRLGERLAHPPFVSGRILAGRRAFPRRIERLAHGHSRVCPENTVGVAATKSAVVRVAAPAKTAPGSRRTRGEASAVPRRGTPPCRRRLVHANGAPVCAGRPVLPRPAPALCGRREVGMSSFHDPRRRASRPREAPAGPRGRAATARRRDRGRAAATGSGSRRSTP